jgi:hypothetical protein
VEQGWRGSVNHRRLDTCAQPGGDFVADPDEQAQSVVRMVFGSFAA